MIVRAFLVAILSLGCVVARGEEITVAAAISLKESLEAIRPAFEKTGDDKVKFTFASSGQLASQVQNGAPVDLFLSAARKQVDDLKKAGKTDEKTAVAFTANKLVLIVPAGAKTPPSGFEQLADPQVKKLAMGEPKSVPAGEYAQQTLDHLKLADKLKDRIVFGLNVRQVLQYVQSGEVDAGLVYQSDARQAGEQVKVIATADESWHQPIEYWGVVIANSKSAGGAKRFLDYLQTEPARAIFKERGFAEAGK